MKALVSIIIAILLGLPLSARGNDQAQAQEDFSAANQRLLNADAKGALALYEHLVSKGLVSADLYYNLGNAYATLDRPLDAVVAYEKSRHLDPSTAEATEHNLYLMRQHLDPQGTKEADEAASNFKDPMDVIRSLVAPLDANLFAWMLLIANLILFICLGVLRYGRTESKRRLAITALGASAVLLLFSGAVTTGHYVISDDQLGVVRSTQALKEGPHLRFDDKGQARIGARVRYLDQEGEWTQIKTESGKIGWIPSTKLSAL